MNKKALLLTEEVNQLLVKSDVPASLTIEQCAKALAMSMTTFRRKLSQEDTSFKLIQQKYLNELSVNALLTHHANIEDLVLKLGYSERATFERAFRHKFGITPSQFRELSRVSDDENNPHSLSAIAHNMPPLSGSCQQLIEEKDQTQFDIPRVLAIIAQDPIFSGRLMGLASRAIYGKTPNDLQEAVSRNLGLNTVVNLAVVYSVKDALSTYVDSDIIEQASHAFLMAPKLFQLIRKLSQVKIKLNIALTEQVLVFSLLGILLLCHKKAPKHELVIHSLRGIDDLSLLNGYIDKAIGVSIFSASTVMLSLWHIDASVIKKINQLDKVNKQQTAQSKEDELIFFMLSCLHALATKRKSLSELEQKAELLAIDDFSEIKAMMLTSG